MKNYLISFLVLIAISAGAVLLIPATSEQMQIRLILLSYFTIVSFAFHYGLVKSSIGRPQVFIRYFMAATTIKLFLHLGVIVFYAFSNKEKAYIFILTFMIFYFVFTAFEVYFSFKARRIS